MAKRWIVLTADRDSVAANQIIEYTEWDGRVALSDEVIYTDPVDIDGNSVDDVWKVGGIVMLAAGVYTYSENPTEPTLVERQRAQIHDAYLYWRINGRTDHWTGLRRGVVDPMDSSIDYTHVPMDATDKWAYHVVALVDQAINGAFPITGYTAEQLQAFIDHAVNILRTLGPTWYLAQLGSDGKQPTEVSKSYAGQNTVIADNAAIYTDIVTATGVHQTITGVWVAMAVSIRAGFNPEDRNLGN